MKIDFKKFKELEVEGYLRCQTNTTGKLYIWNYSAKTQIEQLWTPETLLARGLITTEEGIIVKRPFSKFFNYSEHAQDFLPDVPVGEDFEIFEKADGSLGILYSCDYGHRIASRGSFTSEQSVRATTIFQEKYSHCRFDPNITYLFEIIYPENRIVVDYGETEDLILLAMIDTESGMDLPLPDQSSVPYPVVKTWKDGTSLESLMEEKVDNFEGWVIRFESGLRVKVKLEEYVRIHRIVTNLNNRRVWEALSTDIPLDLWLESVPDEFYSWALGVAKDLKDKFKELESLVTRRFREIENSFGDESWSRKDFALKARNTSEISAILFAMLDCRPYSDMIWKKIRPEVVITPFKEDSEYVG